jgi:indole-3-glycerol phosphate synthase
MSGTSDFLAEMACSSAARVAVAKARVTEATLRERIAATPAPPSLRLDGRFDLIAELKLRSPALGVLAGGDGDLESRVTTYADAGAAVVSVLTEPDRFGGTLEHLERAARTLAPRQVPVMRKDFLVDPYQVVEARAAGAGGVLLIVRMLPLETLRALIERAAALGLFVLIETFDAQEVRVAADLAATWAGPPQHCLLGINSRDLRTLKVVPGRLETLVAALPRRWPRVAESGLQTEEDARRLAAAGYTLALVGTALMAAQDPAALGAAMIASGRAAGGGP